MNQLISIRKRSYQPLWFILCAYAMLTTVTLTFAQLPKPTILSVEVPDRVVVNQPILMGVTVKNEGGNAKAGGISISFPDRSQVSIIYSDTTKSTVYPIGYPIWSNSLRRNNPAEYPLVEAWQEPWKAGDIHQFQLRVEPTDVGELQIFIRATTTIEGREQKPFMTPKQGRLDQQGFPVEVRTVQVEAAEPDLPTVTINQVNLASYPEVACYVVVTDINDNPIDNLTETDFSVLENGQVQYITNVAHLATMRDESTIPTDFVLAMDRSGSMGEENKMVKAKEAARTFIKMTQTNDRAKIISFSNSATEHGRFTNDRHTSIRLITELPVGGSTALFDATVASVRSLQQQDGIGVAIVFTDGIENSSRILWHDLTDILKETSFPVYTVGLGNTINEFTLKQIASDTGGRYLHAPNAGQLTNLYRKISNQIHRRYRVTYTSSQSQPFHGVVIRVNHKGRLVQDVTGYVIPG